MKHKINKQQALILVLMIIVFVMILFLSNNNKKKNIDQDSITKISTQEYDLNDSEGIQNYDSSSVSESTIPSQDEEEPWDGDSVGLDNAVNSTLGDCNLNDEVLSMIDHDTETMTRDLQLYLYSQYEIDNVQSLTWDNIVTIDYSTHNIQLTFDVDASESCTVKCVYSQTNKEWSFYKYKSE